MTLAQLFYLIDWDLRINRGLSFDDFRAKLRITEVRLEQYIHRNFDRGSSPLSIVWYLCRFLRLYFPVVSVQLQHSWEQRRSGEV